MFKLDSSNIYFEDDFLLIINKPAGMLIHPTVKEDTGTMYNYVKEYYQRNNISADIHPVSRLDRNTSGLVIFAKDPYIQFLLSKQDVKKRYLAITENIPSEPQGTIEAPIARKPGSIIERCVSEEGKYARTDYKSVLTKRNMALLELTLYTGRTHQIRVHLAHIGCPIVNDNLYGAPGPQARHSLHAYYLGFKHPIGDMFIEISCALPKDLRQIIYY